MSIYYEYMIWADVTQTVPAMDEEPVSEIRFSLYSRLVNGRRYGQRWNHVTRTDKIKTIIDYVTTIVGGVTSCIIIPQTGVNKKFTPVEVGELFSKARIGKDKQLTFTLTEPLTEEAEKGEVLVSVADIEAFRESLARTLSCYDTEKDPELLYSFMTSLHERIKEEILI